MVRDTSVQLAPPEIGNSQIVDYRQRNADTAFALMNALVGAPPAPELPTPLPPPPLVPMSYMNTYREQVEAELLSYHDQAALYVELRGHLQDDDGRDAAVGLLRRLRQRRDIVESVGRDIDALLVGIPLEKTEKVVVAPEPPRPPTTPPGWYPDPTGRFGQRYWDGAGWTDNVARNGQQFRDLPEVPRPPPPLTPTVKPVPPTVNPVAPVGQPFDSGTFVLLLLASILCTGGLVGIIAGAMNMAKPARRNQAKTLLWVGVGVMGLWFAIWILAAIGNASSGGN
jgi:hypothetical protein